MEVMENYLMNIPCNSIKLWLNKLRVDRSSIYPLKSDTHFTVPL